MVQKQYDGVDLKIYENRSEMGQAAAKEAADCIKQLLTTRDEINCMFAAAPSQNEFLKALVHDDAIPWERINAYHMDDYIGFGIGDPRSFNGYLTSAIFGKVPFKSVNLINGENDPESECRRYGELLKKNPLDIVFMGIGENGHIAFNDPSSADFQDKEPIKIVELEQVCRQQQVHDGCFKTLDEVPTHAFTVTVPGLVSAAHVFCIVPGKLKAAAAARALTGSVEESCPASILRRHPRAHWYIDEDCAGLL